MAEESVGVGQLFGPVASCVVCAVLLALGWVAVTGDPLPAGTLAILFIPFINAHVSGVRHRWPAALAALAVGGLVGAVVGLALPDGSWGHVGGMIAGSLAAVAPYALVTQVGRPRPAPAGSASPAAPG